MTGIQKDQISNSLVFTAMILLVAALGIGSGLGIVISFVAVLLTAGAVVISTIESHQMTSEDPGDEAQ